VPTDIVERLDNEPITGVSDWNARMARLAAGDQVSLHVRGHDGPSEVRLTAAPLAAAAVPRLGLTMRAVRGAGAEVTNVDAGSIAERAGLRSGDVITRFDGTAAPTPAQVSRAFAQLEEGRATLAAVTRGAEQFVVAILKP
jgi:serine protease DegQ